MIARAVTLATVLAFSTQVALSAELPQVKAGSGNKVPECVTPGRLMAMLGERNARLDKRYDLLAVDYMRIGEDLQVRWDIAFFQMLVETGNLTYTGDVKPAQNNFAGLGATGKGEPGESFPTVSDGVKAHLQHILMYAGEPIADPVAERTRKVQEWGILNAWRKGLGRPVGFRDLARKWAPSDRGYASDMQKITSIFMSSYCGKPDPRPELLAMARGGAAGEAPRALAAAGQPQPDKVSGEDLARKARLRAQDEGRGERAGLGGATLGEGIRLLNAQPQADGAPPVTDAGKTRPEAAGKPDVAGKVDAVAMVKPPAAPPAPAKCRVWTASYGGTKSVIIKVASPQSINYTVLDVNEATESREVEAFISAYARGGSKIGDFRNQSQALEKAFELCPEG